MRQSTQMEAKNEYKIRKGMDIKMEQVIMPSYRVLIQGGEGTLIEKKSKFITALRPVESEEEAILFIEEKKKQYWDASHNCFAYIIGKNQSVVRCGDDGEPAQTAGKPMLEVLLNAEICNAAVVVTRYFGGTLLGTGGLVRAYSAAVKEGLINSRTAIMQYGYRLFITTDYHGIGKLQYIMGTHNIEITDEQYGEKVSFCVTVPQAKRREVETLITEATGAQARIEILETKYFPVLEENI